MANFLDNLKGVMNTNPLSKDSPLDIRNVPKQNSGGGQKSSGNTTFIDVLDNVLRRVLPFRPDGNAGESEIPIPKAPTFVTPDPVWRRLKSNDFMDIYTKSRLYQMYLDELDSMDEEGKKGLHKKLVTDPDYLTDYIDKLWAKDDEDMFYKINPRINSIDDAIRYEQKQSRGIGIEGRV